MLNGAETTFALSQKGAGTCFTEPFELGEGVLRETRHFVEDLDSLGYMGLKTR
jgi:hypothetical protein